MLPRRTVVSWLPLPVLAALGACALRPLPAGRADTVLLAWRPVLRFAESIRPALAAFVAAWRAAPDDPAVQARWRGVLAPAERVLSEAFLVPVRLAPQPGTGTGAAATADAGLVRLEYRQDAPLVALPGSPAYARLAPLLATPPAELRRMIVVQATLSLEGDRALRADTAVDLLLEHRDDPSAPYANAVGATNGAAVQAFSLELLDALEHTLRAQADELGSPALPPVR